MAQLIRENRGPVWLVRFNNPPMGYMDSGTVAELEALIDEVAATPAVRVLVFAGAVPGVFIRHYSVEELVGLGEGLRAKGAQFDENRLAPERGFPLVARRIEELPIPTIAAINGHAMGGGCEFALACDIRVAERGPHSIGLPEVNIGLLPGGGGTQKLARLVGMPRALEMVLRGRTVDPEEAARIGLVHEVADDAVERALTIAAELAKKPPKAVAHIKRLVRGTMDPPSASDLGLERTLFLDLVTSDDAIRLMRKMVAPGGDIRTNLDD
jgi:enoyl-CoA hydratase/carnithine racemase